MLSYALRLPFLLAVALVAAALADPLVETIANSGVFGHGYDDNNHLSVLPVLVAGALLGLVVIGTRVFRLVHHGSALRTGDWVVASAKRLSHGSPLRDLPIVLALQFAALFAMESVEQLAAAGRMSGGDAWLGGPIVLSLLTHVALGAACTFLLAALARSVLATVAALVRETLEAILGSLARDGERAIAARREDATLPRAQAPCVSQLGGRAPPRFPLAA